ncbi:MAG: respiratory nitrate reductase subunit gamma [Planctomycetota bacterium]|jgi:nitrate reductase gamma subunit
MSGFALLAIAYVSLAVFVVIAVWRTVKMARLPVHLRWELAPVPHEKGKSHYGGSYLEEYEWWTKPQERSLLNELTYMFKEIVFLRAVWEHNRRLWWFPFPFHFGIYLLIGAAGLVFLGAVLGLLGVTAAGLAALDAVAWTVAAAGYGLGLVGSVGLLVFRLADPRLKASRTAASLFNLAFLIAVFLSGGVALLTMGGFAQELTRFIQALVTVDTSVAIPGGLAAHLVLVFLFLAYLPCTQMLHFVAKYFTYHQVRWDDKAMVPGSRMEREVQKRLGQPVTWSGAHLQADGKKNWVDIVAEEVSE